MKVLTNRIVIQNQSSTIFNMYIAFVTAARVPEFLTGLKPVQAVQGRQARFEVEVDGQPPPTITWYKGARELVDSNRYEIGKEGDRYYLIVKDCYGEDADEYTCKASNPAGTRQSRADLVIRCKYCEMFLSTKVTISRAYLSFLFDECNNNNFNHFARLNFCLIL